MSPLLQFEYAQIEKPIPSIFYIEKRAYMAGPFY